MNLCVIPARGGSKRIPRKNVKEFCGKPIIAWSIEAALASGCFDKVIVSTDDAEIAETAVKFGAEAPFLRPESLSDDHTGTTPVVKHAVIWFLKQGVTFENVCCIYATAPFISADDIRLGLDLLVSSGSEYAFSVTSFSSPIQRAIRVTSDNRIEMFYPEFFNLRSQDLQEAFHDAGQFYWGHANAWIEEKILFSTCSTPIFIPRSRVIDIDTIEDWDCAEMMFSYMKKNK